MENSEKYVQLYGKYRRDHDACKEGYLKSKVTQWEDFQAFIEAKTEDLRKRFQTFSFHYGKLGSRLDLLGIPYGTIWGSIWVTDYEDIQIGRLIFKDGAFSHSKIYGAGRFPIDKIWGFLEQEAQNKSKGVKR